MRSLIAPPMVARLAATCLFVLLLLAGGPPAAAADSGDPWWSDAVTSSLERAGERRAIWEQALRDAPVGQRTELAFLLEHMPDRDLAELDPVFVLENVALACAARDAVPWGRDIPEAVFLNDVLPYANISERRDPWRAEFKERFLSIVADCKSPGEAAHRLNQHVFRELGVRYSTERKRADQSPAESIETGMASCTGLSIVLTDACRAVGVPARLAGIPSWANKSGNHTWVEIWDGGGWHFAGAAEPDPQGLDRAWFVGDAALAKRDVPEHAIYAISYRRTGLEFPMVFDPAWAPAHAVNVTDRYARPDARADDETRLLVTVLNERGVRVAVPVTVRDLDDPASTWEGLSRDETFDTNDVLEFTVARGSRYEVKATEGASTAWSLSTAFEAERAVKLEIRTDEPARIIPGPEAAAALLDAWFADPTTNLAPGLDGLVRSDPARARDLAWNAYKRSEHPEMKADFDANRVRFEQHESPYVARRMGERPANGWPLVIAMHGGGGAPKEVNDRGWKTMQRYYRDQTDLGGYVYLALRAPNDTWNGFYADYVYPLVTNLVRQFLLFGDVDPNRVYLIGYSHGGYGAFSIGPKIPHRFAAIHASAAAPTDGDSVPRGLRNTPFTYMIGENDNAYGRRERCEAFDRAVSALRGERDDVYPVVMEFKEGFGHGGLPDRDKIRDLYRHVRVAHPRELSWEMTDTVVRDHFWLSVPDAARGRIIEATCRENTVDLDVTGVSHLTLRLDERLVDPDRPVIVRVGDTSLVCTALPSMRELCGSIAERGDPNLSHTMRIEVDLEAMTATPSRGKSIDEIERGAHDADGR